MCSASGRSRRNEGLSFPRSPGSRPGKPRFLPTVREADRLQDGQAFDTAEIRCALIEGAEFFISFSVLEGLIPSDLRLCSTVQSVAFQLIGSGELPASAGRGCLVQVFIRQLCAVRR